MIFVGIDNGLNGAIVAIDSDAKVLHRIKMPVLKGKKARTEYDIPLIRDSLLAMQKQYGDMLVGLEKAQVTPVAGKNAAFGMGYCYGMMQGLLTAMAIPFQVFRAQDWQKEVLMGINGDDTKQRSIIYCKRKYPLVDWRATERSINDHDGLTDACCIANYVRMKNGMV
jgi:hypothetical protein